jgi:hypothetical protein
MKDETAPPGGGLATAQTFTGVQSSVADRTTHSIEPSQGRPGPRTVLSRGEQVFTSYLPIVMVSSESPAELRRRFARHGVHIPPNATIGSRPLTSGDLARECGIPKHRARQLMRLQPARRRGRQLLRASIRPRSRARRRGRTQRHATPRRSCRTARRGPPGKDEPAGDHPAGWAAADHPGRRAL